MRGEYDRDDRGRRSSGLDLGRSRRDENVDVEADQVGRQFGQLFGRIGPSKDKIDVPALDIAVVSQAHPQCSHTVRRLGGRTVAHVSDLIDLRRLLRTRLGDEKRESKYDTDLNAWRSWLHEYVRSSFRIGNA